MVGLCPRLNTASRAFLAQQRNAVLVGGTGSGEAHLAVATAHLASPSTEGHSAKVRLLVTMIEVRS